MIPPRFRRAVNAARPYGAHRFDVFGPKVARPLTLYGWNAFYLWLRLVDFWVHEQAEDRLLVVLRPAEAAANAQASSLFPAFETRSRSQSMVLRTLRPDELDDPELLRRNRLTMLRQLAASVTGCAEAFALDILEVSRNGVTLGELEHRFAPLDPTVLRAAAFKLVLSGALQCPTLATQPLGLHSLLVAR